MTARPARPAPAARPAPRVRWLPAAAVVLLLGVAAAVPQSAGRSAAATPEQRLGVDVTAPESAEHQPLTVWDVAFGSARPHPDPDPAPHTGRVTARITVEEASAREVTVTAEGPGTLTPSVPVRFARLQQGAEVPVTWRWAAPVRTGPPPYDLAFTVRVAYTGPDGDRRTVRASDALRVRPPAPPEGDVHAGDLPFSHATSGYGPPERDRNNGGLNPRDGGPIRLDGVEYANGLGTNARSVLGFHLGGRCTRFTAVAGIDDVKGAAGSVVFRVRADGRTLFDSGTLTGASPARRIAVDVTGVRTLELVGDPTADGQAHDWADWADASLSC